jgi:integrase
VPFSSYLNDWLTTHRPRLKASTVRTYEGIIHTHLLPHFGDATLQGITVSTIREFVAKTANGKTSPKTVNNALVLLKTVLKQAEEDGVISSNPARAVKQLRYHRPEMHFLTPVQVQLFFTHARRESYPLFLVGFSTGLRLGELLGLQWGDVDFGGGFLHVRRSVNMGRYGNPKSDYSRRKVVLIPQTRGALHTLRVRVNEQRLSEGQQGVEAETPIFWNPKVPKPEQTIRREFHRTLSRADLPAIRLHDMRHTYASLLIHQGESPKFIQAQLGHSSIETTFDLYGHLFPEAYEGAANRLQAALFGADRPTIGPQTESAPSEIAESRATLAVSNPAAP